MRNSSFKGSLPAGNPIASVFVVIAGTLIIAASIVLGFFAFVALSGIVLVTAAVVGIRVWWLNRKIRRQGAPIRGAASRKTSASGIIEGEYHVISKDRDEA